MSKRMGNGIAIAFVLVLSVALLLCGFWCTYMSPSTTTYEVKQAEYGSATIEGLKNWNFPYILKGGSSLMLSVEVLEGARANVLVFDPDSKIIRSQNDTTYAYLGLMAVIPGAYYVKVENPNAYSMRYHIDLEIREFVIYRPLEPMGSWFFIFSIPVFGLAFGLSWPAAGASVREANLSKENAYGLMIDNLPKMGIRVKRSDEPSQIIAEVGDWKRWLLSSQPWADIKVDISQKDDRSRIEFSLDFRKMYGSYVAMLLVLYLLLASVWVAFTAGYARAFGLGLFMLLLFPIALVTPKTHKAKEQFMSDIDRFLPSVW